MRRSLFMIIAVLFVSVTLVKSFAETVSTSSIPVTATINGQNSINVTISKVVNSIWSTASSIDFGTLTYNSTNSIFTAPNYYALDVTVASNSDSWTVTHTANSVSDGNGNTLDSNINVGFVKQTGNTTYSNLTNGYVSFANSNAKSYSKTDLSSGWLRIYYGIGTGSGDNTGVTPINATKPAGTYTGSVVLTLTTS